MLRQFILNEDGGTAIEYAVILGTIVVVIIVAVSLVGKSTTGSMQSSADKVTGALQ